MSQDGLRRAAGWTTAGSILSAVAASACCWAPLLLIAFGASAAGVSAAFEQWRPWFLLLAGLLLGFGFYLQYFRKTPCASDCGCGTDESDMADDSRTGSQPSHGALDQIPGRNRRSVQFQRATLWAGAVLVLAFALFPTYAGELLASVIPAQELDTASATVLTIEGMTCDACSYTIQESLRDVPGVTGAEVSYDSAEAKVTTSPDMSVDMVDLIAAVERAGYHVLKDE